MKIYRSLFRLYKGQPIEEVFAHFYPINGDFDQPFKFIASNTIDGRDSWSFQQQRFISKYSYTDVPKLKNYLNYTFKRMLELEQFESGLISIIPQN